MLDLFKQARILHFLVGRSRLTLFFILILLIFSLSSYALTWTRLDGSNVTVIINQTVINNGTINQGKTGSPPYLFNDSNTMFFNETKLNQTITSKGGTIFLRLDASNDPVTGILNIINNFNVTGNTTQSGFVHIGDIVSVAPLTAAALKEPGDVVIAGEIVGLKGFNVQVEPFGQGLTVNDFNESTIIIRAVLTNDGDFDGSTDFFCDPTNGFTNADVDKRLSFTGTDPEITAPIQVLINSSCVKLTIAQPNPPDFTGINYFITEPGIFTVFDGGHSVFTLGSDPDSGFEIIGKNVTSIAPLSLEITDADVGIRSLFISTDFNGFSGNLGIVNFITSSKDLIGGASAGIVIAANLGRLTDGIFNSLVIEIISQPNGTETTAITVSPHDTILKVRTQVSPISVFFDNLTNITEVTSVDDPRVLNPIENINGSVLYVGNFINFTQITFVLESVASEDILPKFFYCNGTGYQEFTDIVTDNTNGFQKTGTMVFINPTDRGVCNFNIDGESFSNETNFTYIAIQRTNANVLIAPILESLLITKSSLRILFGDDGENMVGGLNALGFVSEEAEAPGQSTFYFKGLSAGNSEILLTLQNGLQNGSASALRNSFYVGSTVGYNPLTQRVNTSFLQDAKARFALDNVTSLLDYDSLIAGSDLGVQHGIETTVLISHEAYLGFGTFDVALQNNTATFFNGVLRVLDPVTFVSGFNIGDVRIFVQELFLGDTTGIFINDPANINSWLVSVYDECDDGKCARAQGNGALVKMNTTFDTLDLTNITVSYTFATENLIGSDDLLITINNGSGLTETMTLATGTNVVTQVNFELDGNYSNTTGVTISVECDATQPTRFCWFDTFIVNGTVTSNSTQTVNSFDSEWCASTNVNPDGRCARDIHFSAEKDLWTINGNVNFTGDVTGGGITGTVAVNNIPKGASTSSLTTGSLNDNGVSVISDVEFKAPTVNDSVGDLRTAINVAIVNRISNDSFLESLITEVNDSVVHLTGDETVDGIKTWLKKQIFIGGFVSVNATDNVVNSSLNITDANGVTQVFLSGLTDSYILGNLGIGTISPGVPLHVVGTDNVFKTVGDNGVFEIKDKGIIYTTTLTGVVAQMLLVDQDTSATRAVLQLQGNAGSTEVLFAAASGDVGINTITPAVKLEIEVDSDNSIVEGLRLTNANTGTSAGSAISFFQGGGDSERARIEQGIDGSGNGNLRFYTGAFGSVTETIRFDENGNVGINQDAPITRLHVGSGINSTAIMGSSNNEGLYVNTGTIRTQIIAEGSDLGEFIAIDSGATANQQAISFVSEAQFGYIRAYNNNYGNRGNLLTFNIGSTVGRATFMNDVFVPNNLNVTNSIVAKSGNVVIGGGTTDSSRALVSAKTGGRGELYLRDLGSGFTTGNSNKDGSYITSEDGVFKISGQSDSGSGTASFFEVDHSSNNGKTTVKHELLVQGTGDSSFIGDLGIGDTTPDAKLDVLGSVILDIATSTDSVEIQRGNTLGAVVDFVLSILDTSNPTVRMAWILKGITNDPFAKWSLEDNTGGTNLEYYLDIQNSAGTTFTDVIHIDNSADVSFLAGNVLQPDDSIKCYGASDCSEGRIFWNSTSNKLSIRGT